MQIERLKDTFARNAQKVKTAFFTNSLSRFFFRHAGWVSFAGYAGGNVALSLKNGLHPFTPTGDFNYDGAAGLSFLAGTLALPFTNNKKHTDLAFRLYGVASFIGIGLLAYSGYHNNGAAYHDWWKALSPLLCWTTTAALTLAQKEIAEAAEKARTAKSALVRAFGKAASYPVAIGAGLDATGIAGVFKSASNTGDWKMKLVCGIWSLGVGAFGATDPRLQEIYKKENQIPGEPPKPDAAQPAAP